MPQSMHIPPIGKAERNFHLLVQVITHFYGAHNHYKFDLHAKIERHSLCHTALSPARLGCTNMNPRTMYRKIWESHLVRGSPGEPSLIYIDRHLVPEVTTPQAFAGLKAAGRHVRRPDLTFAVMDHSVPTK